MTAIINLTCENRINPLGMDVLQPRLSWQMQTDRRGAKQQAYRILAASAPENLQQSAVDLWDSGKVDSDQSVHIPYAGKPLQSRQRIYWKVMVWDEIGSLHESASAWFEMGLLNDDDWQAQWIGAALTGGPRTTIPAPYLTKQFQVPDSVQSARLYVTALGLYECSINGQSVSEDVFNPGWTDYRKRVRYQVFDVTNLVQQGENRIGAILGDGWAVGHVGWDHRQQYVDRPRFYAQLEMKMPDGSTITVVTDSTWKTHFGALLENDLIMGEAYDARLEIAGWDTPDIEDNDWSGVEVFEDFCTVLTATNGPTVRPINELPPVADPVEMGNLDKRRTIFDLGQNMVGRVRFRGTAPAGTTITLRFAEMLNPDGTLYTANLRAARATDYYTFKGNGVEVWEPKFTFHGFRYVELSGYPGTATRDTITGIVLHSEMAVTGEFVCSDPMINQLQSNILWGQKGNFLDVPTDCPQRDERLGWTGDIQVFTRTAAFNMNIAGFLTKWAQDVADAQDEQGQIPPVVPKTHTSFMDDGGPAWADAAIICPWTIYLCYNDTRILENNYTTMSRFMEFIIRESPGYIRCAPNYQGWLGFGDWLSINADTPRDLIGTAFLAYDAGLMAQIAAILGKPEDAERYQKLFSEVREAFGARFLKGGELQIAHETLSDELRHMVEHGDAVSRGNLKVIDYGPIESEVFNTELFTPTQTAYVLALHFDLLPDELKPVATAELVEDIKRREMHLSTGFVGSPYLAHVLSDNGRLDVAYELLNQKTWPSWLYPVTQGATTIWERWDGWTPEYGFQTPDMNSFNHYAYGAIGAWLYSMIGGIEIDPAYPGYQQFILRPQPGGGLEFARTSLQTAYGKVISNWSYRDNTFVYAVVIPPNTSATVYLPFNGHISLNGEIVQGETYQLEAGAYEFIVNTPHA